MKKFISILLVLLAVSSSLIFADTKDSDPFDTLVEKLLKDFDDYGASIAVKVFNGDLGANERKQVSKSVQFALYCNENVEIAAKSTEADYIVSGKVESDGPNYIVTAKLVDAYDDTVIGKAKQKVPKNYYATSGEKVKVETVVVEHDVDAEDILGAVVVGSVIGGVFHAVTHPHYAPAPAPRPRPIRP